MLGERQRRWPTLNYYRAAMTPVKLTGYLVKYTLGISMRATISDALNIEPQQVQCFVLTEYLRNRNCTAAFHARVRGSFPDLGGLKGTKMFLPYHSVLLGASVTERWRARPQTARARISNPVSGGHCHLTHLIILRRFS